MLLTSMRTETTAERVERMSGPYLLCGQSNMQGKGLITDFAAELQAPITGANIWRNATTDFATLEAGVNNLGSLATEAGPELKFSYDMTQAGATLHLIKYAVGATDLANDWKYSTGPQWTEMLVRLDAAMTAYTGGGGTRDLKGILWMQGETDGIDATKAANYQSNLTEFINELRAYIIAQGYASVPIKFVMGRIKMVSGFPAVIQAAQEAVASSMYNVALINTASFAQNGDALHFSAAGQTSLGAAYARHFL